MTYCNECGANNKNNAIFCSNCGTKLDYESEIDKNRTLLDGAIKDKRWKDVNRYFSEIDFFDNDDYKSVFYVELAEYWTSNIHALDEGQCIAEAFDEAITILKKNDSNEIGNIIVKYSDEIYELTNFLRIKATRTNLIEFQSFSHPYAPPKSSVNVKTIYLNNLILCVNLITIIINHYKEYCEEIKNDERLKSENFDVMEKFLTFLKEKSAVIDIINQNTNYEDSCFLEMEKETVLEIKKYDSSYTKEDYYINDNCDDFCINCGEEVFDEDKFCPRCGHSLPETDKNEKFDEIDITDDIYDTFHEDSEYLDKKDLETILIIIVVVVAIILFIYFAP